MWNVSLSVGGFLGVGWKIGEVLFSTLKFEPGNSNCRVMLPNVSKDQLNSMTDFTC